MTTVTRFDRKSTLGKVQRTPQGGIRVEGALTRSGIFVYQTPGGGVRREYRPPDEVERADSLELLADAPVTDGHPPGMVDARSYRIHAIGHVSGEPRMDAGKVVATLLIQDQSAIEAIESGKKRELSCGYTCELDETPGVTPSGERYDGVQREIRYNHVALVPRGRAGRDVSLRLDSELNQTPIGESLMEYELIEGVKYEVGTDPHKEAVKRRDAAEEQRKAEFDTLKARCDELSARFDSEEERFKKALTQRLELVRVAERHGVEVDKGADDAAIRMALLAKLSPRLDCADKSEVYVQAALDCVLANNPGNAAEVRRNETVEKADSADVLLDLSPSEIAHRKMTRSLDLLAAGKELK